MTRKRFGRSWFIGGQSMLAIVLLCSWGESAFATKIKLTLQDAPLTISRDTTVTKKISGIPSDTPGKIHLDFKWHSMTLIPNTFNKLKIELLHGSNVLHTDTCLSIHALGLPRCGLYESVNQAEADASGDWKLRISNSSSNDVNGFNILKEITELNPMLISISMDSSFEPDCSTRELSISEVALASHATIKRSLSIPNMTGEIVIKAKWHVDVLAPFFNPATVALLRDGQVVKTDNGYSIHSDQKNKIEIRYNVVPLLNGSSHWELQITNDGPVNIKGFGIAKGNDSNPFVPDFKSTFRPGCN